MLNPYKLQYHISDQLNQSLSIMRKAAARIILLFPTIVCAFYGPVDCTVGGSGIDAGDTRVR